MTITMLQTNMQMPYRRVSGQLSGTYTVATVTNALLTTTNAEIQGYPEINSLTGAVTYPQQHVVIAAGVLTINPGFAPKYVKFVDVTQDTMIEWYDGVVAGDYIYTAANGTRALETDSAITVTAAAATSASPVTSGTSYDPVTYQSIDQIVVTLTGLTWAVSNNDLVVWVIEG